MVNSRAYLFSFATYLSSSLIMLSTFFLRLDSALICRLPTWPSSPPDPPLAKNSTIDTWSGSSSGTDNTTDLVNTSIEPFTNGNTSALFERKFLYRMGPVFRESLWPDQWSHRVPLGIKYLSTDIPSTTFQLIPLSFLWVKWFWYYSHSKSSIFSKSWKCWKLTSFAQQQNSNFWTLFFKWLPFLD